MPFADPSPTQADVSFRLFGFPVRIHPFFWLICVLLARPKDPASVLLFAVALLVSILVHELGHAVLQRHFGGRPSIVLYGFGGLAISNGPPVGPWRQIAISLAGPGAGFVLAGIIWLIISQLSAAPPPMADRLLVYLLYINIAWGIFNLLPIYPLDGGHVSRELLMLVLRPNLGIVVSLWISIVCCALAGAWLWVTTESLWNLVLMGALGFNNYQTLEGYNRSRGGGW